MRPVSEALAELNAMLQEVHAATRTAKQTYDVSDVVAIGGAAATRISDTPALPDTLVYVVNFDGDNGFAVLGAHRALAPVFAITENGNLDPRTLERKIGQAYDCFVSGQAAESVTRADDSEYTDHDASYPPIVPELLGRSIAAYSLDISGWGNTPNTPNYKLVETTYSNWEEKKKVGPLVEVKWHQRYPFNMSCPESKEQPGTKYAAGCVMVAIGQIMATNKRPTKAPAGTLVSYNWTELNSISNYMNVDQYNTTDKAKNLLQNRPDLYTRCKHLSDFLTYLGVKENCNAYYSLTGTEAYDRDAERCLKHLDAEFYKNATVQDLNACKFTIYEMLNNNKPIYAGGYTQSGLGHAWVIDGYMERQRTRTDKYESSSGDGITYYTLEHDKLFHCNWGWCGFCDGYYIEDIFDLNDRINKDEIIDEKINTDHYGYNFKYENTVITY